MEGNGDRATVWNGIVSREEVYYESNLEFKSIRCTG